MGAGDGNDFGALIDDTQVAVAEPVTSPTLSPRGRGRSPAASGGAGPGSFYEPTVLVDVDHSMDLLMGGDVRPNAAHHEGEDGR